MKNGFSWFLFAGLIEVYAQKCQLGDEFCQANGAGRYCKYWLNTPVCHKKRIPCPCHIPVTTTSPTTSSIPLIGLSFWEKLCDLWEKYFATFRRSYGSNTPAIVATTTTPTTSILDVCPPNGITSAPIQDDDASIVLQTSVISSAPSFNVLSPVAFQICRNFCEDQTACLAFSHVSSDNICRIFSIPVTENLIMSNASSTMIFYCERSKVLPLAPNPTSTTSPVVITISPFLGISCPESGFLDSDDASIDPSDTSLTPLVINSLSCSETCASFSTCSAFTVFNGNCTLYAGNIEDANLIFVQGSTLSVKCNF